MSLIAKFVCPEGIVSISDKRTTYTKNGIVVNYNDDATKSFEYKKAVISVCGAADYNCEKIDAFLPRIISESLIKQISEADVLEEIARYYINYEGRNTTYLISYYLPFPKGTLEYLNCYSIKEPIVFKLKTATLDIKKINNKDDIFSFGVFHDGANDKSNKSIAKWKEDKKLNMKDQNIKSSIVLAKELVSNVITSYNGEHSYVSNDCDMFIQRHNENGVTHCKISA